MRRQHGRQPGKRPGSARELVDAIQDQHEAGPLRDVTESSLQRVTQTLQIRRKRRFGPSIPQVHLTTKPRDQRLLVAGLTCHPDEPDHDRTAAVRSCEAGGHLRKQRGLARPGRTCDHHRVAGEPGCFLHDQSNLLRPPGEVTATFLGGGTMQAHGHISSRGLAALVRSGRSVR